MRTVLALLLFCLPVLADDPIGNCIDVLHMTARQTNGLVPISKARWKQINDGRKLNDGHQTFDYGTASTNGAVNRSYFHDSIKLVYQDIQNEFHKEHGRFPVAHEIYAAWVLGPDKFRKLKWDVTKIRDDKVKLGVQKVLYEMRLKTWSERMQPPPLPPAPPPRAYVPPMRGYEFRMDIAGNWNSLGTWKQK